MSRLQVLFSYTGGFNHAVVYGILHFYEEQRPQPISSSLTILGLAYPTLISFLNLKYMSQNQANPFQTHPKTTRLAVITLLLYCMLVTFSSRNIYRNYYAIVFRRARMLSSGLSLALTTSLFFADEVRPVLCVVCVLFCIADWVLRKIVEWSGAGRNLYNRLFRRPSSVTSGRPSIIV